MIELYWSCLIGGVIFSLVSFLGSGHVHHGAHWFHGFDHDAGGHGHDWLNPMTVVGGITVVGGAGILLTRYTGLPGLAVLAIVLAIGVVAAAVIQFAVVRPLEKSESSLAFPVSEYVGKTGQVSVPIPASGYGEVMFSLGTGVTVRTAASIDSADIPSGSSVVVVEIVDNTLYVTPFEAE